MSGDAREIQLRDEILELLYWLEGEGFDSHSTVEGMLRFLAFSEADVRAVLERLIARGEVSRSENERFHLTDAGHREAARRFADDFAPLLRQGHGECNDPTCDCHENPEAAVECHRRALAEER
jgi:hypothetical protein